MPTVQGTQPLLVVPSALPGLSRSAALPNWFASAQTAHGAAATLLFSLAVNPVGNNGEKRHPGASHGY
jgi:hypothetical protein